MDRRARQHEQTAAEIVDAAEQVVLEGDLEALTVQAIARAVNMTPGALYRYFPSRDAVVAAVQARVVQQLAAALEQAADQVTGEDAELVRLFAVAGALLQFARTQPRRYGLLSRMLAISRPLVGDAEVPQVLPSVLSTVTRVEGYFAAASLSGALCRGDDRARLAAWWAVLHGAVQLNKLARFSDQMAAEKVAGTALAAMALGWGASGEHVARAMAHPLWRGE